MAPTHDWDAIRREFAPDQLRLARELRRLTQGELAQAAMVTRARSLTAAAISQFELGAAVPSNETLEALVDALNVDPVFITAQAEDVESDLPAFFRSLRSTPAADRKRARNLTQLVHQLARVLDDCVGLPPHDVPELPCDPFLPDPERRAAAEDAAARVRREWSLPPGPVDNVIGAIEQHGVICARLRFDDERVDAFSVNFSDHPIAVLATDKAKWDRSRFDAAHELGHLVMHHGAAGMPEAERQAHEFAAAFLMPAKDIKTSLPDRADWAQLFDLKARWGTSIASLLMRAKTLGVMTQPAYVSATKVMSARGWRKHEPVDGRLEAPTVLKNAMQRALKRGHDPENLRRAAAIPQDLFHEVCELIDS